jgi:hypothetical protein
MKISSLEATQFITRAHTLIDVSRRSTGMQTGATTQLHIQFTSIQLSHSAGDFNTIAN